MRRNDIMQSMWKDAAILPEPQRKRWTAFFVAFVVLFTAVCLGVLNYNYDSLARYPYKDEKSRQLIKHYLNQEEIDYIIEYSIPPNMFIAYIQCPGFSIYHAAEYKKLSESEWMESPAHIVTMVEETRQVMDTDTLIAYLADGNYSYSDLHEYLTEGDPYHSGSTLVSDASGTDLWLDDSLTVSTRIPSGLAVLPAEWCVNGNAVSVLDETRNALSGLMDAMSLAMNNGLESGGLLISRGYVSFEDQEKLFEKAQETYGKDASLYVSYPGHSEHQLGLAVDFAVSGIPEDSFEKTAQSQWLEAHAWEYGFVRSYAKQDELLTGKYESYSHYRYIGTELAVSLHEQGITFAQYAKQEAS